jgi:Protein of unknown function (DUF998)
MAPDDHGNTASHRTARNRWDNRPISFITLVIVQGILQPDYSHIAMPISALAAWPAGWMQNLNFFVSATLTAAFTIGLHNGMRPTRFGLAALPSCSRAASALWWWASFRGSM